MSSQGLPAVPLPPMPGVSSSGFRLSKGKDLTPAVSALAWSEYSCLLLRGNFNMFTTRRSPNQSQEQSTQLRGDFWWELNALPFFKFVI